MIGNNEIKIFIQNEKGSDIRNKHNEKTLEFLGKAKNRLKAPYPYPYGFILDTSADDGDNLDCYVITNKQFSAGEIISCEVVGLIEQYEEDEIDHKIIAVIPDEAVDLERAYSEIGEFIYTIFSVYDDIEIKVGELLGKEDAMELIENSRVNK